MALFVTQLVRLVINSPPVAAQVPFIAFNLTIGINEMFNVIIIFSNFVFCEHLPG
jgi:hypothetical protein